MMLRRGLEVSAILFAAGCNTTIQGPEPPSEPESPLHPEGEAGLAEPTTFLYLLDRYNADGIATQADFDDAWGYYERSSQGLPGGVPRTLENFKTAFSIGRRGIAPGASDESLDTYRQRIRAAVYYNVNELGLGREMACTPAPGFVDTNGELGQACFVTNYGGAGDSFYGEDAAMQHAIAGGPVKNTVAISFRPSQAGAFREHGVEDGSIQFWVYDQNGVLQDYAQLDDLPGDAPASRPVPGVCTECHGARQPYERGLVVDSGRFLPANPFGLTHLQGADIQERLAAATCAAVLTSRLTLPQQNWVSAMYADVCTNGSAPVNEAPAEWRSSVALTDIWKQAVSASCATCHLALDRPVLGHGTAGYLCDGLMPHAYPTWLRARGRMGGPSQIHGLDAKGGPAVYDDAMAYVTAFSGNGKGCDNDDDND
ncbi:MAG TPA: hypothetical protein VMS65_17635 [Polyangiaceae bacterium]|nr:hypothetical protein [Polyangiaceae bacterium]